MESTKQKAAIALPLNGKKSAVFNPKHFTGEAIIGNLDSKQVEESEKTLADFEERRVTKEKFVPESKPVIRVGESPVAAPGNVTAITAEGKSGKTALQGVITAGAISTSGVYDGFPDLHIEANIERKAVIHFDTEQSESDQQYNLRKILERSGKSETPDYYLSYNIRTLPLTEYQAFTNQVCDLASEAFNGIHLIIVDGGADYISSVNDEAEANAIISYFTSLAVKHNCAIVIIIHLNENAGKNGDTMPRGHLGRQAVRKGYAQLNITKEGDISTLEVLRARKAGAGETPLICFKYDKEKGYHVSVDAELITSTKQSDKEMAAKRRAEALAKKIFAPPAALLHKDAISQIMKATGKTESTAKRYLNDLCGWGLVKKHDDGLYRLIIEGSQGFI